MAEKELKLKVAEAVQDDVNKGIVRIDSSYMQQIGIRPGDIVEIEGDRKTVSIADRAYPGDIGLNIIRMDGLVRRNSKTGIGEIVKVRKADVKEAKKVVIAPQRKGIMIRASSDIFKQGLLGRALMKGDIVSMGGTTSRRTTLSHSPFEDIFRILDEDVMGFGFGDIKFVVVDVTPKQAVIVTNMTEIVFNPEAVEAVEESTLEVTYEDIGGLHNEIHKVREMVELPLKHPEIFERLGIEAPKGVLLHGPPGTGKTLLAKAVANETNSHFILINGPEIMSKYYGQSLPYDEKILIREKGMLKRVPIGKVVEEDMQGIEAVCFDGKGKVALSRVTGLIKHPLHSKIVRIKTSSGRSIRVTDCHSLFTLTKNGIESVKTSDLKEGSFIAVPSVLPFNDNPLMRINLLDMLTEDDYGIRVINVQQYLRQAIKKIGMEKAADILKVNKKYLYDIIGKNVGVRARDFMRLMDYAQVETSPDFVKILSKGKSMPSEIVFSEDLWTFFGLWMAEGSYTSNAVRLSIHRREEKQVSEICNKLFGSTTIYRKPNSQGSDILICSFALKKIMKNVLGFVSGARNKKVPDIAYNLSRENTAAFLRGYISGDGHLNLKTPAPMVEIATESFALADDIAYLLLNFGIVAKIYSRKGRPQKRICFADTKNLDRFREIGFLDAERNTSIFLYVQKSRLSRTHRIPSGAIPESLRHSRSLSAWSKSDSIGKEVLLKLGNPGLKALLEADIYWDKISEISLTGESPEFVYDISVEPSQNFVSGFGGVYAHNSELNLRKKFEEAEKNAPSIIFIDEIDAIAAKREEVHGEVERRVVAQLLALMDGLKSRGKVVVIAATNVPNLLDPALRRPGRFDREIEIGVPSKEGRLDVLKIHTRNMPLSKNVALKEIAAVTHGFVGADLAALAKEAAMVVLRRVLPDLKMNEEEPIPKEILEEMLVTRKDFREALKVVRPSAMREVLVEVPTVQWKDIGGLDEVKQELKEAVEWPIKNPDGFRRLGIRPPRGILMYGAPGTGKTLLAKAVATESEANFIHVKGPELLSKWVGESEKAVREVFKKARQTSPTIIFFDEIDSLAPRRGMNADSHVTERVVNQLLTEMDGLEDLYDVVVLAATNRPDMVDAALLRPGRFDRLILTPVPDEKTRLEIFRVHTKNMPLVDRLEEKVKKMVAVKTVKGTAAEEEDEDNYKVPGRKQGEKILEYLARISEGHGGADIEAVCREAAILALRKDINARYVTEKHFIEAMKKVRPSITKEMQDAYKQFLDTMMQSRIKELKEEKPFYMG